METGIVEITDDQTYLDLVARDEEVGGFNVIDPHDAAARQIILTWATTLLNRYSVPIDRWQVVTSPRRCRSTSSPPA